MALRPADTGVTELTGWSRMPCYASSCRVPGAADPAGDQGMDQLGAMLREPSAQLMLAAYLLYAGYVGRALVLRLQARGDPRLPAPSALTWVLFAIGTGLHVGVELLYGVPIRGLYADMICGTMSIGIALLAVSVRALAPVVARGGTPAHPENLLLKWAYASCALIYLLPGLAVQGATTSLLDEPTLFWLGTASLLALNLMGVLEFVPILKETWRGWTREWALPWLVWTLAYVAMWQVRLEDLPAAASWSEDWMLQVYAALVMLHPALSVALHVLMAIVAVVGARAVVGLAPGVDAGQPRLAWKKARSSAAAARSPIPE